MKPQILVLEDDEDIAEIVERTLSREGFAVKVHHDGQSGLDAALQESFDALILDLMLPRLSGEDVLLKIREKGDLPVLVLSAKDAPAQRVAGLNLGADDYLDKPFLPAELTARLRALLRRCRPNPSMSSVSRSIESIRPKPDLFWGDELVLNREGRRVFQCGREHRLSGLEYRLLELFMSYPGKVFTKDSLIESVWGRNRYLEEGSVSVQIRRLRKKIERDPSSPRIITTVWGIGYRMEPAAE